MATSNKHTMATMPSQITTTVVGSNGVVSTQTCFYLAYQKEEIIQRTMQTTSTLLSGSHIRDGSKPKSRAYIDHLVHLSQYVTVTVHGSMLESQHELYEETHSVCGTYHPDTIRLKMQQGVWKIQDGVLLVKKEGSHTPPAAFEDYYNIIHTAATTMTDNKPLYDLTDGSKKNLNKIKSGLKTQLKHVPWLPLRAIDFYLWPLISQPTKNYVVALLQARAQTNLGSPARLPCEQIHQPARTPPTFTASDILKFAGEVRSMHDSNNQSRRQQSQDAAKEHLTALATHRQLSQDAAQGHLTALESRRQQSQDAAKENLTALDLMRDLGRSAFALGTPSVPIASANDTAFGIPSVPSIAAGPTAFVANDTTFGIPSVPSIAASPTAFVANDTTFGIPSVPSIAADPTAFMANDTAFGIPSVPSIAAGPTAFMPPHDKTIPAKEMANSPPSKQLADMSLRGGDSSPSSVSDKTKSPVLIEEDKDGMNGLFDNGKAPPQFETTLKVTNKPESVPNVPPLPHIATTTELTLDSANKLESEPNMPPSELGEVVTNWANGTAMPSRSWFMSTAFPHILEDGTVAHFLLWDLRGPLPQKLYDWGEVPFPKHSPERNMGWLVALKNEHGVLYPFRGLITGWSDGHPYEESPCPEDSYDYQGYEPAPCLRLELGDWWRAEPHPYCESDVYHPGEPCCDAAYHHRDNVRFLGLPP